MLALLKQKRAELCDKQEELVNAAMEEERAMTDEEQLQFQNFQKEIDELTRTIESAQSIEGRKERLAEPEEKPFRPSNVIPGGIHKERVDDGGFKNIGEFVNAVRFGEIQGAWFSRLSSLPTWGWGNWLLDPNRSGGAAFDMHIHDTDFILYLLGKPQAVYSTAIEDQYGLSHISTQYLYDKLMVTAESGWNYPAKFPFQAKYRVIFRKAVLALEEAGVVVYPGDGADPYQIEIEKDTSESSSAGGNISDLGGYYNEIKYYLDCLEKGEAPKVVTAQSARESVAVTLAEIESAKTGKLITIS